VSARRVQGRDLGLPCRGCGQPLTELGSPLFVWRAGASIRRFHPDCAEAFEEREPTGGPAATSCSNASATSPRASDGYADAWRRSRLSERSVQRAAERQEHREAHRRWPLYPTAGMLWRAGTLALQQERRGAGGGASAWKRQLEALRRFTSLCEGHIGEQECAICLGDLPVAEMDVIGSGVDKGAVLGVLALPCDPSHAFHEDCLAPWLQRSPHCPKCRADLRPLLCPRVAGAVAASVRAYRALPAGPAATQPTPALLLRCTVEHPAAEGLAEAGNVGSALQGVGGAMGTARKAEVPLAGQPAS